MPKFNETNQTGDTIIYLRLARGRGKAVLHNFFTKKDTLYHIQLLVGKLNYEYILAFWPQKKEGSILMKP